MECALWLRRLARQRPDILDAYNHHADSMRSPEN
jgi:hypothetical protein